MFTEFRSADDAAGAAVAPSDAVPVQKSTRVTIVDFDISFSQLVEFFVKAAFAAVPAAIIVASLVLFIVAVFGSVLGYVVR